MLNLGLPDSNFDAVICVFGIFFVPDMSAAVRELWRRVRPGGKLAITTWGPRFFEPATTVFWECIRAVRPDLYKGFNPWDRISGPEAVISLLTDAGVDDPEAISEAGTQPVASAEDWWSMVLGSGYRGTLEQMHARDRERVRLENLEFINRANVKSIEANVVYARAGAKAMNLSRFWSIADVAR
jgi:SAM-dependent methyltransferase